MEPPVWVTKPKRGRYERYALSDSDNWDSDEQEWKIDENRCDGNLYHGLRPERRVKIGGNSDSDQSSTNLSDHDDLIDDT